MTHSNNTQLDPRIKEINGKHYMTDAKGALVPIEIIKPIDKLMDELVGKLFGYAAPLAAEIGRFKGYTFADVDSFIALIAQEYGSTIGGKKGNITLTSYDGLHRVQVAVADHLTFGPELQVAKSLVDECLREWANESRAELRAVVESAFDVDKEGKINRAKLFSLLRYEVADTRWQEAMRAIRDSIRVTGSKRYVRFYKRPNTDVDFAPMPLDIAAS